MKPKIVLLALVVFFAADKISAKSSKSKLKLIEDNIKRK